MPNYVLMLNKRPTEFAKYTPDEVRAIFGEFVGWRDDLFLAGKFIGGEKLKESGGKILSGYGQNLRVADANMPEEIISGVFTIAARDYDEAVEIAACCPPLKFGGRIELREIEPTE